MADGNDYGYVARMYNFLYRTSSFGLAADGPDSPDWRVAQLTGGLWGQTAGAIVDFQAYVYEYPQYPGDYRQAGVCAATGYRGAGSAMVTVDGVRYLKDFAPSRVRK